MGRAAGGGRPTSRDVARAAGVSQATVSLVLGGKWRGRVSQRTVSAVRKAAGELGYRPNPAARSLRTGRTGTALLVVPALTHEYFARVCAGASGVAAEHGFGVVLYPSPAGTGPARDPFGPARAAIDGVIASSMAADALAGLGAGGGAGGLPLVMLDSDPTAPGGAPTVNLAIADGIRATTRHLLALGHRRIAHLAGAVDTWTFRVRAEAVAQELRGVPGAHLSTARCALDMAAAREAALGVLGGPGPRPTALLCDGDLLAAGAYKAARALALRVPRDLSVTGFDDLSLAVALEPELTTVRLPAEAVGAAGMTALLALLDGGRAEPGELPVRLVVRGSTGPAAH